MKILAVVDVPDKMNKLKAIFREVLPETILLTAQNEHDGIALSIAENPDIILFDLNAAEKNFFELCRLFKTDQRIRKIPLVLLTVRDGDTSIRAKALEAGVEAFLCKPIDPIELTAQIRVLTKIKQLEVREQDEKIRLEKLVDERTLELNKSNELNKSLLQTIPFGMDIVDESGNILFVSEKMAELLGKDAVGKKCWHLYKDDRVQCSTCPLIKGIALGDTYLNESVKVVGGKTFQVSHTGMIFEGKKAMLEIFQDITEKKEVEKQVKLLAHSLESISECVSVTDESDIIIYVNKSFTNTYGYSKEELIGKHISILRPTDIALEHVRNILSETIEGGWRGEVINRKKDGTLFPILLSTSIIKDEDGTPIALVGAAIDISDMQKSRKELVAAKEKAEESNRLKSAFLNNMSHEIRTPMNHIMGFSSLMSSAPSNEKDAYAEIILSSSNQLMTLIENMIMLSRLQSEKAEIDVHKFKPSHLLQNLADSFNNRGRNPDVPILVNFAEGTVDLVIRNDQNKMKLLLVNLISNAIKYTFKGYIEIGLKLRKNTLTCYVKDTGMGIPAEEQNKIFDSFYRGEQAIAMVIGGAGLGLSIVRELAGALNGAIEVESLPGQGSCFCFTIPIEPDSTMQLEEGSGRFRHLPLNEVSILVAEDEPINFLYLDILLKSKVKKLDHARNGKETVEMAAKNHYDLILVDLKMPEMDGFEATRKIKQDMPHIPVIAQTAYVTTEDKAKAIGAGCDDLIAKPIKKEKLIEMIEKYT